MIWAIAFLLALAWFWMDSLRSREQAQRSCEKLCQQRGVQFLDATVAVRRIRPQRDHNGRMKFARWYNFEYTDTGDNRRSGQVMVLAGRVSLLSMEDTLEQTPDSDQS